MNKQDEQKLVDSARQAFDGSVEHLDAETRSAIVRRRRQALEGSGNDGRFAHFPKLLLPAGALATLATAVLLFTLTNGHGQGDLQAGDLEVLSSSESLEFYEDLEFYQWLDDNDLAS